MRHISPETILIVASLLFAVTTVTVMQRPATREHEASVVISPDRPNALATPLVPRSPSEIRSDRV
jgi:hypothetical protein